MATHLSHTVTKLISLFCFLVLANASCEYGFQNYNACEYGCCGDYCCPRPPNFIVGPIVGSIVSLGAIIAIICCSICLCRRRSRQPGIVIHSTGAPPAIVFQQNAMSTQGGVVNTSTMPPGIAYPPQSYGGYPYPADGTPQSQGPPAYHMASPPSYKDLGSLPSYNNLPPPAYSELQSESSYSNQGSGGVVNPAFKS